jgi:hypothetical protein
MNKQRGLSFGEKVLLFFACVLTLGSLYFYINNKSLQSILLETSEEFQPPVGSLKEKTGTIKRESLNDSAFDEISENAILYNNDTIMTSKDGSAILKLNDDGELNLSPNTMVRLNLDSTKDTSGLYKTYQVEILKGEVTAESAPKNEKTKVFLKSKSENIAIVKGQKSSLSAKKDVPVQKIAYPDASEIVLVKNIEAPKPTPSVALTVAPTPIPVKRIVKPTPTPVMPPKSLAPKIKELPKVAVKPIVAPPEAKCPVRGLKISISKNIPDQNGRREVFLTWKRQAVEDYYEVQISLDEHFGSLVDSHQSQSNFYSFIKLRPSVYWWRIKTMNKNGSSTFAEPSWFQLLP